MRLKLQASAAKDGVTRAGQTVADTVRNTQLNSSYRMGLG